MSKVINRFTYSSMIDNAVRRKKSEQCSRESSRDGSFDFTQSASFEEAVDFAIKGWDLGLEQYQIEDGVLVSGSTELSPCVAGCLPHVQNHIMGFPEQMYNLYDNREYNLPTMHIVVNLAYSAWVDSSEALEFGKSLVSYINSMASTHNIKVTGLFASNQRKNVESYEIITLKDYDSALVINNIAFAFHPSFFRRIWFSFLEGMDYWDDGYGGTVDDYYKEISDELGAEDSDKLVVFKTLNNIGKYEWLPEDLPDITLKYKGSAQ